MFPNFIQLESIPYKVFKGVVLLHQFMELPERLESMLSGAEGLTRQKAARLVIDLAKPLIQTVS